MAADIERQVNIELNLDSSGAEKKYNDVIKKIEEPVKIEIDADVKKAIESIKELQQTLKALTNQGKDGEKLRINVAGIANLQQQLKTIDSTLGTLTNHFTGLRRSVDIQAELNDNRRSLDAYKNSFTGVVEQIDKLKTNRSTDDFFDLKKTKNNIRDIMNNNDFATIYEGSESNVSRLLVEIAKAANETDGLAKSIQISEDKAVTLGDVFKKIAVYINEATNSVEKLNIKAEIDPNGKIMRTPEEILKTLSSTDKLNMLGIKDLSAEIINTLGNIQKLENEIPTLQAKFDDAVNREKAGSINVQIDSKSIEELSNTISELKGVFKVDDGSTIGIKEDDINRITESFTNLQTVLENIHSLLESFDVPRIKVPEIEKQESKPAHESRQTTTVSSTIPTINGGTRTISHTNDSSVSTSSTTGIDSAIDGQNRLQQEYRETRQEAESTQDILQEVEKQESVASQSKQDNRTLEQKLALLKEIKSEYKFLETADEKRIDMEEKAWDAGGNNPKSEADSQKKINTYNELCEHIEQAEAKVKEFEAEFSKVIIHLKNGEKIKLNDFVDLSDTSLDKRKIKDIQFFPNFEGYIQDAYDDMRKMDDWIDENVNRQMKPPAVWTADNQEEIESAIQKLTEFRDRAKQIMSHEGFSELSQSMQEEVRITVTYFDNLIKTEQRLLDVQKQFDEANAERPISSGVATLPEQEREAGQAGQQMGEQIAHGMDQATESVNTYREALNKSFATNNKRDATSQLRTAFNEYQKYFGKNGSEADKITRELSDEARIASYNYSEAYKEALKKEISETNLSRYRISDFGKYTSAEDVDDVFSDVRTYIQEQARILEELGNPKLSKAGLDALNEYMEQWDVLRKRQSDDNDFYMENGVLDQSLLQADINYLQILKESLEDVVKLSNTTSNQTPINNTTEDIQKLQLAIKDAVGSSYAVDSLTNPLISFIREVQDNDLGIETALQRVEQLKEFQNKVYSGIPDELYSNSNGMQIIQSMFQDITSGVKTAQDAYDEFIGTVKNGSAFVGNEGKQTVLYSDSLNKLSTEWIRLNDVINETSGSSNPFEQAINKEAQNNLQVVERFLKEKNAIYDANTGRWINKPVETPVSTQEVSASEQAVESHERATQAALEHADAARQALEAEGQKPASQDISGTEAQANANRDEANAAQEAAQAEKERADAVQQANEAGSHVDAGSTQVSPVLEQTAEAHERAAEAAQHHAEEAKKAAEAESEQPSEPSTSNTEKQIEANQAEAESAREAAQAEQEKQDVIASQSSPASNQANAVQQGAGQIIQSLTDEEAALDRFKDKLQTEIPNAVDTKTQAFRSEQVEIDNLVSLEESSLQRLVDALQRVADKATEINAALGQTGKDNNFSSFLSNIKENEQALIAFAEVLKKTNEEQAKVVDKAKILNAKVVNENPVDPSQWKTVLAGYDELVQKLGGVFDIVEETRRDEKTQNRYISYHLKGPQGTAIVGKNNQILDERTQYSDDYTQELQRQKERADIIKQAYGEIIKSIDDYKQAATDLNNFEAQSSRSGTIDLERRKEVYKKMEEAAQKAADSVKMAFALTDMGDITPKQMADVQSKYDQAKFGSEKSQRDREVAARNAAYKEQIDIIEQATSTMNKYNDALTKDIKGESVFGAEARAGMSEEINRTSEAADIAIGKIRELGEQGKITAEQLASAEMKYRESWTGSDSSIKSMQNAINQRNTQQEKSWAEMEKQQIQEATKAIDNYYKTANKGRELQIQSTIGQSAKASGQLNDQITAMNDLKTSAEGYLNTLKQLHASGNTTVSSDFLKQYEDRITAANEIQQNLLTDSGKVGFENTEKQFETLIQYAQRYYDILHKPEESRTYADKNFLLDYGKYYEDAIKQAEQFAKSSDEAQKKMGESFLKSMDNADVESYKNILNGVGQELDKLGQKQWTKAGSDELDNMSKQYEALYQKLQQFSKLSPDELSKFKEELANILKMQGEFSSGKYTPANPKSATNLSTNMSNFMANNSAASMYFPQIRALQDELKSPDLNGEQLSEIASKFNQIRQAAADAGKMGRSFGDALKKSFSGLTRYMATYVSFYRIIGAVKSAIATVKEFDTALMEVRKVSTETLSTLQQWQKTTFDMANSVGGSAIQIQKSTASWLRLGKDFQEAQKAAQASTKLLNVSEFTNIDDATKSLVSISQAYKDLTYDDVIDKLNNVGDHFSSSTDQLAQGLQNAAAVLKTQGNSIDEALALLTAGNDITQDISKTSAGIRTIALRISGTEEAKNEIADLGEDVDDFVVRTKSKTDQIIKDYTAVASNAYKGISVLDENGNLRNTYDILLDISKVYKEIQETDKKAGTNRAAALVETLAGKNRSNIAASILQNPELLEQAYKAAQHSEGVGDYQLSVYKDTIEAKTQEFKNAITELSTLLVDSDGIKTIIGFFTDLMNIINKIPSNVGGLTSLIGVLGGLFLQKNGYGLSSGGHLNRTGLGHFNFLGLGRLGENKAIRADIGSYMSQYNQDASLKDAFGLTASSNLDIAMDGAPQALKNYVATLDETERETLTVAKATKEAQKSIGTFATITSKAKGVLATFGSTLVSIGISMAASFAISKVFEGIKWIIDEANGTHQREAAKKSVEQVNEIENNMKNVETTVGDNKDRYLELYSGVTIDNNHIKNVSLANDEYQEFLDINNKILDVLPSLQTGFDAQGNRIADLGKNAEEAGKKIKEATDYELYRQANEIKDNIGPQWKQNLDEQEDLEKEIKQLQKQVDDYEDISGLVTGTSDIFNQRKSIVIGQGMEGNEYYERVKAAFQSGLMQEGLEDVYHYINQQTQELVIDSITDDEMEILRNHVMNELKDIPGIARDAAQLIPNKQADIKTTWKEYAEGMVTIARQDSSYKQLGAVLGDQFNESFDTALYNMDWYKAYYDAWGEESDAEWEDFVSKNLLEPMLTALNKGEIEKQNLMDFFTLDATGKTNEEFRAQMDGLLDTIYGDNEETKRVIRLAIGYTYLDENGQEHEYQTARRNRIFEAFGGVVDKNGNKRSSRIAFDDISTLLSDQQDAIINGLESKELDPSKIKSFQDLLDWLDVYNSKVAEADHTKLSEVLGTEEFDKQTKTYVSNLSSLTSAIDEYAESGEIADATKKQLEELFPDLTKFDTDDASFFQATLNKRLSYAQEYMRKLYEILDYENLSDKEKESAQNYFQTTISGLDLSGMTEQQAKAILANTIHANDKHEYQYQMGTTQFQNIIDSFGEDTNWEIVAKLALNPALATWTIEEWIAHYENETVKLGIELDKQQLEKMDSDIARMKADNDEKSAEGGLLKSEDYQGIYDTQRDEAAILNRQINGQRKALEMMQAAGVDTNSQYYIKAQERLNELETQLSQKNTEMYQTREEQIQAGVNATNQAIERNKTDATKMEAEVEQNTKDGIRTTRETYKNLENTYTAIANGQESNAEYWEAQADLTTEESRKIEYLGYANTARQEAADARDKAATYSSAYENDTITQLGYGLDELKAQAQEVNDIITLKQAKGLKVTEKEYKSLADITRKQVANLRSQNDEYKNILDTNKKLKAEEKRQYQSQIDANNSAIASALADIEEYNRTMDDLVVSNAKSLASAISSALSESLSGTGLETETINSLISGFSDLGDAADLSSVFYGTADGVKVDLVALQRLAQQQNQIINQGFDEKMNAISQAIEQASKAGDTTGLKNAQDELAKLQRQQSQYFATYEEQMKQFNRMSQIEFADQTDNAGKNYESAKAYLESAKEMWDKGLIGTDDFKARAAYFDPYGRTDADTFLENYNRKIKYYTDDHTGVKAFLDDMVSKSLATYDKENGGYKLDFSDFTSAAKQMQFSEEELTDMLNRTVDYGFSFQFVSSMEEATLKASDLQTQLANASIEYADLIAQGADSSILEDKAQEMRDIETEIANLDEATQNYTQTAQKDFIEGFQNLPQTIDALKDAYKRQEELGNESEMQKILANAQAYADKYGIKLNIKDFTIDEASYEAAMTNFIGGTKFGDVDLLNRKRISPEAMREFYPEFEGDYATLYSRAYSSEDGKTAVVVTPILPNGDVLEENALAEYAGAIAEGTEPPEQYAGITMATFKGEDAIEMANRYAEVAHSHEMFVDQNNAAMQKYLNTLKEFDNADLQAIEFGDGQTQIEGAEQALDGMLQQLGLGQEYGEALLQVLSQMGLIDYTPEIELGPAVQEVATLNDKVKQGTSLLKKMQANGQVDISFNMDQDPTQIADLSTLTQRRDELVNAQVGFSVDQSQYAALQSMIDKYNTQIVIRTILEDSDDAKSKLEELQELATSNPDALVNVVLGPDTEATEEQVKSIQDTVLAMSSADYPITVKIADEQMQSLTNQEGGETTMKILGDNSDAKKKADEAEEYAQNKKPVMNIGANGSSAISTASFTAHTISSMNPTITISANTTGITETLRRIMDQQYSIRVAANVSGMPSSNPNHAAGTMIARSNGTAYNVVNYKPIGAYAKGRNVALGSDEDALTNELGQESVVRDGRWYLLPGGPHMEHLKKGDIVFSADQTKDLLAKGKTATHARALASGTVGYNGMSAFSRGASGGGDFGGGITNSSSSKQDNSSSDVSKDISNAASETKSALDSFKEWVEKFVDWIEVRLSRLQSKVDLYLAKSENAMGIGTRKVNGKKEMGKNDYINEAMRVIIGAINTTDPKKAKNGTLIGDNQRGMNRYQKQADATLDKAKELGLLTVGEDNNKRKMTDKEINDVVNRIKKGTIDISQYNEDTREFINTYTQWHEKMMECSAAVEELRSQLKELQQTKLDNIVARFDALSGRSSAIQDSSKAIVDYYTAVGRVVNSPDIKQQMNSQRVRQQEIVKYNKSAVERYEKELANAAKIFGEDSQEFHEAGQKLAEMKTAWVESETALKNLNLEIQKLKITKLQYVIDRVSGFGEKLSAIVNLRKTQGTLATGGIDGLNLSETDYSNQINNNNTLIEQYGKMIAWQQQLIDENHWDVDSEQYKAAYDEIQKCETALLGLYNTNLQLKESIRDMRWEAFEKLQSNIANSTSDFEHLRSLISSAEIWDDKDQTIITKEGYANIALMGEEMRNYNQTIADNRVALEKLQEEYNNGNISLEKFEEESKKHINTIQSSVTAYDKLKDSIVDLYKTQLTNENKALQELIKKRQDALKAKKS